jgi:UDP-glucose 4-epimerase
LDRPRVLITGAGGFLGRNLARHLSGAGFPLTLISLRDEPSLRRLPHARLLRGPAHRVVADLDLGESEALVHFASSTNPRLGAVHDEVRQLDELAAILERARRAPGLSILFPSSGGTVYRDSAHGAHTEEEPLEPKSHHAWGKVAAEGLVQTYARAFGLPFKILRCANPYGPWQSVRKKQGLIMKVLDDLHRRRTTVIWGDGEEVRDYLCVADLCDLLERMLLRPGVSGVFNVGSGVGVSVNEVLEAVATATGIRPRVEYVQSLERAVRRSVLDSSKVSGTFDWTPSTSLSEGIRAVWDWLLRAQA